MYKIKYKENREINKYKGRLVENEYTQQEGLDYHEIFTPVAKMVTVRTVIGIATSRDWELSQMDMNNTFL